MRIGTLPNCSRNQSESSEVGKYPRKLPSKHFYSAKNEINIQHDFPKGAQLFSMNYLQDIGSQNKQLPEIKDIEEVGHSNLGEQRKNTCICDKSLKLNFCWYCDQKITNIVSDNVMNCKDTNSNLKPQDTNSSSTPPSPRFRASPTTSSQSLTRRRMRTTKEETTNETTQEAASISSETKPVESQLSPEKPSTEKLSTSENSNPTLTKKPQIEEPLFKGAPPRTIQRVDKKKITAVFTPEEVAKHNTVEDCWMIIKGGVYDITAYFSIHPGGTRALLKFAGKDGTENVQFHSANMMKILDTYFYIGKLKGACEGGGCSLM